MARRVLWALAILLVMLAILLVAPVAAKVVAASRDGDMACLTPELPEGVHSDETWEHQPRAEVSVVPPLLRCTYPSVRGGDVITTHDLGANLAVVSGLLLGGGVAMGALATRRRDDRHDKEAK